MEIYYVINNFDGDTHVCQYSKEGLLKAIEEGEFYEGIFDEMPDTIDTNYWCGKSLIIKGEVVSPKPKEVVTKYEID
ncbi:MAG: hypothetical protein ACOC22_00430 [bacterium]